jgi:hypothetical protein
MNLSRDVATAIALFFSWSLASAQTLQQQEMCASQAKIYFQEQALDGLTDYESHYNIKLGKCLVFLQQTKYLPDQIRSVERLLIDAYGRHIYANYWWKSVPGKSPREVAPVTCELIPTLAEKHSCKTQEEFDALVSPYMQE